MTGEERSYFNRLRAQLQGVIPQLDGLAHVAHAVRYARQLARGHRLTPQEQLCWATMERMGAELDEITQRLADALRSLTNMACIAAWAADQGDARDLPLLARIHERSVYTLAEAQRARETLGPMGRPAAPTVPMGEGAAACATNGPIDTGHPRRAVPRAERAVEWPRGVGQGDCPAE